MVNIKSAVKALVLADVVSQIPICRTDTLRTFSGFFPILTHRYEALSHVGASFVSLAPTFFKSQSALTPLLLLFSRDPLALGSRLMMRTVRI
ncbi:MAG: hypothetical protein IJP23_02710 [Oscillospiraceae bacterium]|nr:hypothetical protein [Oscillospiraceae bacterium]